MAYRSLLATERTYNSVLHSPVVVLRNYLVFTRLRRRGRPERDFFEVPNLVYGLQNALCVNAGISCPGSLWDNQRGI